MQAVIKKRCCELIEQLFWVHCITGPINLTLGAISNLPWYGRLFSILVGTFSAVLVAITLDRKYRVATPEPEPPQEPAEITDYSRVDWSKRPEPSAVGKG